MKFQKLDGRVVNVNVFKWRVDWDRIVSAPQFKIKSILKPYWINDLVLEEAIFLGRMRFDLININKRIACEISPKSSHSYNKFFHRGSKLNFLSALKREIQKEKWLVLNNFRLVEVFDEDVACIKSNAVKWFKDKYDITL